MASEEPSAEARSARIGFGLVDLQLRGRLAINVFCLPSAKDIAEALTRLRHQGAKSEVAVVGTFDLPPEIALDQPYDSVWRGNVPGSV